MSKTGVGVDIGSTGVRVAAVRRSKAGTSLLSYGQHTHALGEPMPVENLDPQVITSAVHSLVREQKFPKGAVSLGMSNQRMVAREVELPWVPANELKTALPLLACDLLPMAVEEAVLDFLPAEELFDQEGSRLLSGLLVAANEEFVTTLIEAVERAGVEVDHVDFGPLGALRSVCDPAATEVEAVVDVGATGTCLVVHEGNRPAFVRIMARGGWDATQALADFLGISVADAETWKVSVAGLWPNMSAEDQQLTHQALDHCSEPLIDEIRSSINFYHTNSSSRVSRIWLSGGGASQFGLDFQLRSALRIEVMRGQPLHRLSTLAGGVAQDVVQVEPRTATAVGLALAVAS